MMHVHKFLDVCGQLDSEDTVREVLQRKPELLECRDTRYFTAGYTPLQHASLAGRGNVVAALLAHGADVRAQSDAGRTSLHHASRNGHAEVVRVLLEHDAEVDARNKSGGTPLHVASGSGGGKVARLLLEHGADVNAEDNYGATPLHVACDSTRENVAQVLLEHGADVNAQKKDGSTPLHLAALRGWKEVARLLLDHEADRSVSCGGGTPRDVAKRRNHVMIVKLLDTHFPVTPQLVQVLLGLRGPTESPLTRLAGHSLFEPHVLSLIKCLLTGEENPAFEQLQLASGTETAERRAASGDAAVQRDEQ